MKNQTLTYLTLGILVGYLTPYLLALIKPVPTKTTQKETLTNES